MVPDPAAESTRDGDIPSNASTSPVAERLWQRMLQAAGEGGWLALAAGLEGRVLRSWTAPALDPGRARGFADAAAGCLPILPADASPGPIALPAFPGVCAASRTTTSPGHCAIVGLAPAASGGAAAAQVCLALWEAVLLAEQEADRQLGLLQEQRAIIEHITDGLLVVDRALNVKHMNAAAGRILNLNPRQSIGRPFASLLDFEPIIQPVLESGEGYVDRELLITSPRRHLHLIDTAVPIKDRHGRVLSIVNSFREIERVRRIADKLVGNHARYTFDSIIGASPALQESLAAARKAARGHANVLLQGPSGVGKEVFAQAIHNASHRTSGPFIAINCAALPRDLIESELFGYAPGSFTGAGREGRPGKFEAASGGTIFLDEISELPIDVQAKLLRVLQEREVVRVGDTRGVPVDVRVVSASNRDLQAMSQRREFREDLYYRCHVIGISLPSLAERREDIPILANHFLRKYGQRLGKPVFQIDGDALRVMMDFDWPGNVRELENVLERIVNMVDGEVITVSDLPPAIREFESALPVSTVATEGATAEAIRTLADLERAAIAEALRLCGYNVTEAARRLGIAKPTLYAKIRHYEIRMERAMRRVVIGGGPGG